MDTSWTRALSDQAPDALTELNSLELSADAIEKLSDAAFQLSAAADIDIAVAVHSVASALRAFRQ